MTRFPNRRPVVRARRAALSLLALLAVALVPASATAAAPYRFDTQLGEDCTSGYGPDGEQLTIRLRNATGKLLATRSVTINPFDLYSACFGTAIKPGYRLTANGPQGSTSFVLPTLKLRLDRVTNVASGTAPDGAFLYLYTYACTPYACSLDTQPTTTANGNGSWSVDTGRDVDGYDSAILLYRTDDDHNARRESRAAWFEVRRAATNAVTFHADRAGSVTFTLRSGGGAVLATVKRTVPGAGAYVLRFKARGNPVAITSGRRVVGSFAGDASMVVPPLALAFDTAADEVSGTCFSGMGWRLNASAPGALPGDFVWDAGTADGSGAFTAQIAGLADGWTAIATCENQRGDWVVLRGEA